MSPACVSAAVKRSNRELGECSYCNANGVLYCADCDCCFKCAHGDCCVCGRCNGCCTCDHFCNDDHKYKFIDEDRLKSALEQDERYCDRKIRAGIYDIKGGEPCFGGKGFYTCECGDAYCSKECEEDYEEDESEEDGTMIKQAKAAIKSDAMNAGYRIAATQMAKALRVPFVKFLKKAGAEKPLIEAATSFLETELGLGLFSFILGSAMPLYPNLSEHEKATRLADELRIQGMSIAGNLALDEVRSFLAPFMAELIKMVNNAPEIPGVETPKLLVPKIEVPKATGVKVKEAEKVPA